MYCGLLSCFYSAAVGIAIPLTAVVHKFKAQQTITIVRWAFVCKVFFKFLQFNLENRATNISHRQDYSIL